MKPVLKRIALLSLLSLANCQPADAPDKEIQIHQKVTTPPSRQTVTTLPEFFNCVRESGGLVLASHRAGPAPSYPENALETLIYGHSKGIYVHEIDVAASKDGVLFLMHDRTLERTTTGSGAVKDTPWAEVQKLNLIDEAGVVTRFSPPALSAVLDWAKSAGAIVELDLKPGTDLAAIILHIREAGADNHVIIITYTDDQALEVARLAPDLMLTATINSFAHQTRLEAGGLNPDKVIAWTGTRAPDRDVFTALAARGIETAFGTLGRPGVRLDDLYWADGDPSEYQNLAESDLTLLATDAVYEVADALSHDDTVRAFCPLP